MKPNLKTKQQLVKTTFDGQSKPVVSKKIQQKPAVVQQQQQFEPLGESIVGQRQFIYFHNTSGVNNYSSIQNPLDENVSLFGTKQKVYFANASMVNRQESQKNKRFQQQANAFKPSQKIVHEPMQNFNKKPKFTPLTQNSESHEQQDENEFLALNTVGKWNKNNRSTVISQEMKKMNNHLQNRLTETKWAKKKFPHDEQTSKTEKNSSMAKNQSTQINTSANNSQTANNSQMGNNSQAGNNSQREKNTKNSMKVIQTTVKGSEKDIPREQTGTQQSIHVKKGAEKYMEGMSEQAKQRVSSMTSWKEEEKPEESEEVEDEAGDDESQQQEEQQEQDQQEQEESQQQQEQEEEQDDKEEQQDEDQQSSGEQGWDQPQQQQPQQQEPQQVNQDPFTVPTIQQKPVPQVKAKKWGSKVDANANVPPKNPSILVQANSYQEQQQDPDQIQDLTQGEIPNEQVDPHWEKLQHILLRIQKLVN